jgi:SAM-dependent methyltransferase
MNKDTDNDPLYVELKNHYESKFLKHGDNHKGVDWPIKKDASIRYGVMLDLLRHDKRKPDNSLPVVLDFGCGLSHLYEYTIEKNITIEYIGTDISEKFIQTSQVKFPHLKYIQADICTEPEKFPKVNYTIINGVFTEKLSMKFDDMWSWTQSVLSKISNNSTNGVACNFMSKNVDWERDDLFHLSKDLLTNYVTNSISRNFVIRNDYGLYEYTIYIYK